MEGAAVDQGDPRRRLCRPERHRRSHDQGTPCQGTVLPNGRTRRLYGSIARTVRGDGRFQRDAFRQAAQDFHRANWIAALDRRSVLAWPSRIAAIGNRSCFRQPQNPASSEAANRQAVGLGPLPGRSDGCHAGQLSFRRVVTRYLPARHLLEEQERPNPFQ
jgi:hypothetical protein